MDGAQRLLERLAAAGIEVLAVDVARLRSPDSAFAAFWDLCCHWWSRAASWPDWPNPLGVGPATVSLQLWGELRGYQRSHRQLLVADDGAGGVDALVFSRPLHAEAGIHSATALKLSGSALEPLIESEFALAQFSGWSDGGAMQARSQRLLEQQRRLAVPATGGTARARVVTEGGIAATLVARIDATGNGDRIAIAALYLSQRELVRALLDAGRRGVSVRLLLDPGKDGYGYERSGIPNREAGVPVVGAQLLRVGVVRVLTQHQVLARQPPARIVEMGKRPHHQRVGGFQHFRVGAARRKPVDARAALRHHGQNPGRQIVGFGARVAHLVDQFHRRSGRRHLDGDLLLHPRERFHPSGAHGDGEEDHR